MLKEKQVYEVKKHLEKAQNPVFFFDNDPDGLCSFLILYRSYEKGKGVPVKGSQIEDYFRKVNEFNSDYIFILDKPEVSEEFFRKAREINIPVVWIDHHFIEKEKIPEDISYFNPFFNYLEELDNQDKERTEEDLKKIVGEPVTALCYQITQRKEDLWIAVAGCVSDMYLPDFYNEFLEKYPDLGIEKFDSVSDIYYNSGVGTIVKLMSNGLKDKTTNVIMMLKFISNSKTPYEFINESEKNRFFHSRSQEIESRKNKLVERAKILANSEPDNKILFFEYGGNLSISSDLSNKLRYLFPEKVIVVIYNKGDGESNISIRGKNIREILLKSIEGIDGANGGGHEDAVGLRIKTEDIPFFKKRFSEKISADNC